MTESRIERLAPLTGVVALALFSIGAALLGSMTIYLEQRD